MVVSIVVPAYNSQDVIGFAIRSAFDQKNVDLEVLVVDHGSSDGTKGTANGFRAQGALEVLSIGRTLVEKRSASRPLNEGVERLLRNKIDLTKHWLIRLDADDFLCSDTCVNLLLRHAEGRRLVIGALVFFDEVENCAETYTVLPSHRSKPVLLKGAAYSAPHHASLIRFDLLKSVVDSRGFAFDGSIEYGEDFDLMLALLGQCDDQEIFFVDAPLVYKRLNGQTISRSASLISIVRDHLKIFARHGLLLREVSLRTWIDLALRVFHIRNRYLRIKLGFPGRRWACMSQYPMDLVLARLNDLKARNVAKKHGKL